MIFRSTPSCSDCGTRRLASTCGNALLNTTPSSGDHDYGDDDDDDDDNDGYDVGERQFLFVSLPSASAASFHNNVFQAKGSGEIYIAIFLLYKSYNILQAKGSGERSKCQTKLFPNGVALQIQVRLVQNCIQIQSLSNVSQIM